MANMVSSSVSLATMLARRFAERNMLAVVRIGRPAEVDDHDDQRVPSTASLKRVVYEGKARVWQVAGGGQTDFGEQSLFLASSYVSIPVTSLTGEQTQVDDLVEVLVHPDSLMVGRWFRVIAVDAGGQMPVVRRHTVMTAARSTDWPLP